MAEVKNYYYYLNYCYHLDPSYLVFNGKVFPSAFFWMITVTKTSLYGQIIYLGNASDVLE